MREDDALLQRFFEMSSGLLCIVDGDGHFAALSASWTTLLGWPRDELLGQPYLDLVHPDDLEETCAVAVALAGGAEIEGFENRYRHRHGGHRWLRWSAVYSTDEDRIYAVVRDVTEERRQAAIQAQLESVSGVGTWMLDLRTGAFTLSPLTRTLHGLAADAELTIADGPRLYHGAARDAVDTAFTALAEHRVPFDLQVPFVATDGARRWIRITGQDDPSGPRVHGTFQDITTAYQEHRRLQGFEELVALSEEGILELRIDGTVRYANERMARMLGTDVAALDGRDGTELIDADGLGTARRWLQTLAQDPAGVVRGELALRRLDGSRCWVQVAARAVTGDAGDVRRLVVVATDINDQKDREAQLRTAEHTARISEERLERVLAATQDGWWDIDLATGEVSVSARWNEIHGYPCDHVPAGIDTILSRLSADGTAALLTELNALLDSDEPTFVLDVEVIRPDGRRLPVVIRGLIDRDDAGRPVRVSGATSDVSAERRSEAAKEEFVSTVSHELRTPLTAIGGAIEMLGHGVGGELPGPARELLAIAGRNTTRLRRLIDDLLDLEQLAPDRRPLEAVDVPLLDLVERSLSDHAPLAVQHDVTLTFGRRDPAVVAGEPERLEQVLANLLANAAKYAPAGSSVTVHVRVTSSGATSAATNGTRPSGPAVRVEVVDHGPGIPAAFRDRLFERFAQADPSDPRSRGGTGLGLAISRGIVARHGGRVGADSEPGQTVVWFELPLPAAAAAPPVGGSRRRGHRGRAPDAVQAQPAAL